MVTFISLKAQDGGGWGLKGSVAEMVPGNAVTVTKASGKTTVMTVGAVVWSGDGIAVTKVAGGCEKRGRAASGARRGKYSRAVASAQSRNAVISRPTAAVLEANQEAFDEEAAELRACGMEPEEMTTPVVMGSAFELDIDTETGDIMLFGEASEVKLGGEKQIGVRFRNGVKLFNCVMVQRSDDRMVGDGEVTGWIYTPVAFGPECPVKMVRIVND